MPFRLRRKPIPRPGEDRAEDTVEAETLYATIGIRTPTIRLITLLPDAWSEPIPCSLTETKPSAEQPYKSLSYACNNGYATSDGILIGINGRAVTIGYSPYTALRRLWYLRHLFKSGWIPCVSTKMMSRNELSRRNCVLSATPWRYRILQRYRMRVPGGKDRVPQGGNLDIFNFLQ